MCLEREKRQGRHALGSFLLVFPLPFLHGCVVEERGGGEEGETFCCCFSTLLLPALRFGILLGREWWGAFSGAGRSLAPGLHGWIVDAAPGCRLLSN